MRLNAAPNHKFVSDSFAVYTRKYEETLFPGPKTQTESGGFLTDSYQEECSPECCLRPLISPDLTDSEVNQSHLELAILPQHFLQ